jgi:hypothetical protein
MVRSGARLPNRLSMLDALIVIVIVAVALATLVWAFLLTPLLGVEIPLSSLGGPTQ